MSDVQAGIFPVQEAMPLSAYELRQKLEHKKPVMYTPVTGSRFLQSGSYDGAKSYSDWIKEYLYFIDTPVDLTLGNEDKFKRQIIMLVPPHVQHPKSFQGMFEMNAVYTENVSAFYPSI